MSRTKFSIDDELCIGCRLCEERAPENMEVPPGTSAAQVVKQPESEQEEEACLEAAEYCPTGGIASSKSAPAASDAIEARAS